MDIQAEKLELIQMLLETNDVSVLSSIKKILKVKKKDFWDELTEEQKEEIEEGERQIERGEVVPLEDILKEFNYHK